ncbi:hypothetical protein [Shewanella surugensis]|uniref:Methyl-accepting chemotaxis protein n=1 Tax=Shewanella surugensis TaxID=212020 RepID=A0ABT0L816_9GAMM|nr:hypothetical protein [Shewanella surugensis]MCL1123535.1 hypothetical protein [Shewanella surugensis]
MGAITNFKKRRDAEKAAKAKVEEATLIGVDLASGRDISVVAEVKVKDGKVISTQELTQASQEVTQSAVEIDNSASDISHSVNELNSAVEGVSDASNELVSSADDIASATAGLADVVEAVKKPLAAQPSLPSKKNDEPKSSSKQ